MLQAFGDSIVYGMGASTPAHCWVRRLPINFGVPGWQAADVANQVISVTPEPSCSYAIAVGANDVYKYRDNATKQGYFRQCLTAILAWLSAPVKTHTSVLSRTGAWHRTSELVNSFGLASSTPGGQLFATVTGPRLYVGYTIQDFYLTTGTAVVRVNGQEVGTFTCSGQGMTTHAGPGLNKYWGAAAQVFATGLAEGESGHVEIENTSALGTYFYCDWLASACQPAPRLLVGNVLERTAAAYAANQLTPGMTAAYNAIITDVLTEFPNARLVDNHAAIDPLVHLADGVHPNDAGHALLAINFRAAALGL